MHATILRPRRTRKCLPYRIPSFCLPLKIQRRLRNFGIFEAQSRACSTRCLRFTVRSPFLRKTRYQLLAKLCWVGLSPTRSLCKVSLSLSLTSPLPRLSWRTSCVPISLGDLDARCPFACAQRGVRRFAVRESDGTISSGATKGTSGTKLGIRHRKLPLSLPTPDGGERSEEPIW